MRANEIRYAVACDNTVFKLIEITRRDAFEEAAKVCEAMRPHGGRVFTEGQETAFAALSDAAKNIRKMKRAAFRDSQSK